MPGKISRRRLSVLAGAASIVSGMSAVHAGNFSILPTYDTSITSLPNAAQVESAIAAGIAQITGAVDTRFTDVVTIKFQNMNTGLGSSLTPQASLPYTTYLADLQANPNKTALQSSALATMPSGPISALNNNTQMYLTASNLAAIGDTADAASLVAGNGGFNSKISFNFSLLNPSRTSGQVVGNYDLQDTVMHEVNEVLGIGGNGTELGGNGSTSTPPDSPTDLGPLDFFRYSSPGTRSFTYDTSAISYFSIDGGTTDLVHYNQTGNGDYGDWGNGIVGDQEGNTPSQVQDAFGTPYDVGGPAPENFGTNEITALQVVGYTPTAVPEPTTLSLIAFGALGLLRRRRVATV